MNKNIARRLWRTVAVGAATAVAAAALTLAPASAAPVVDTNQTGSITVHKYERPNTPTALPNNGTAVDPSGLTPLAGIGFTIQQVTDVNLGTNAGWVKANDLSKTFSAANAEGSITGAGSTLGAATTRVTAPDGTAAFTALPVGLYLVSETSYPAGVTPSAPFLITVPLTDPDQRDSWLYNVHVYPKNSTTLATKTVQDASGVKLGDNIDFTITADVPNEAIIDGYKITDQLNANLGYVGAAVTLTDGTPIALTTDYTVNLDSASNTVTVEFTEAGRVILANNNATTVTIVLTAKVNGVGEIGNTAAIYPNRGSFALVPGEPGGAVVTSPIVTKWGSMTLQKNDNNGAALTGASFSVYATEADAKAGTNAVTLGGNTVFPVESNGQLTLSGLRYSDWANGAAVAAGDPSYRTYYLVEITAPEGFELLAAPVPFIITAGSSAVGVDQTIVNVPANGGFNLPLTGGSGTTLLYAAGILVLAGGTLLFIRSRRNSRTDG